MQEMQASSEQILGGQKSTNFFLNPTSVLNTDYDSSDRCYVLDLAKLPSNSRLAAALTNHRVKVYSIGDGSIQYNGELAGHAGPIHELETLASEPDIIITACEDGLVREWDLRSGKAVQNHDACGRGVQCCSSNGTLVAAGVQDKVMFWDRRKNKIAAIFSDTHAQDVTQVKFHRMFVNAFISGSVDGFISVFDTSRELDEDEGFKAGLNIETAVSRLGFYGNEKEKLWCCSGTETLHLWQWRDACDESTSGYEMCGQSTDARNDIYLPPNSNADYLVQCHDLEPSRLMLFSGTNTGACGLFAVVNKGGQDLEFQPFALCKPTKHSDVIRSSLHFDSNLWITGGEDSILCAWKVSNDDSTFMTGNSKDTFICRRETSYIGRSTPY